MKHTTFLIGILLPLCNLFTGTSILFSQCTNTCGINLLSNPDFETPTVSCSTADIQLYNSQTPVANWFGTDNYPGAGSSPDYFSPCAGSTNTANNNCITGTARVGIFTKASFSDGREYIQSQLLTPLVAGKTYCFSMVVKSKVGAAGNLLSSCDGIGAWFHNLGMINIQTMNGGNQFLGAGSAINASPQVQNPAGNMVGSSCVTVTGTFCANGNENYIVIGNFRTDAGTTMTGSSSMNYMYIDNVALYELCLPTLDLTASLTNIGCGQNSTLTATSTFPTGTTYTWTSPTGNTLSGLGPHVVSPSVTSTYTLTASYTNSCGVQTQTASVTINVNSVSVTPTFDAISPICSGDPVPVLPTSSTNTPAITGTWSPAVSNTVTGTYTFTPTAGQCATTTTLTITVNPMITPTFNSIPSICSGDPAPVLPASSTTTPAITGAWSPTVSNTATGTYTFTPTAGQCATTTTLTITVNPLITPTFNPISEVCLNAVPPVLPSTSEDVPSISGSWSPAVSTSTIGTAIYTFTPTAGQCATTTSMTIVTTSSIVPTFTAIPPICQGAIPPVLPTSSTNSNPITGSWNSTINTSSVGTTVYTFTPNSGQCAAPTNMDIVITSPVTPTFTAIDNVCQGAAAPILPSNSTNTIPISGTWSPAVNTSTVGTTSYTFTPTADQCATTAVMDITIEALIVPVFTAIDPICQNSVPPILPTTSNNSPSISGTWNSTINTAIVGATTYSFTPNSGQCASNATMNITIDSLITPTFSEIPDLCQNSVPPVLPTASTNSPAISGSWNQTINTTVPGTNSYIFTPILGTCATTTTLSVTVKPQIVPQFAPLSSICQNTVAPILPISSSDTPTITGSWDQPINTLVAGNYTYTFTPDSNQCALNTTMTITIHPTPTLLITHPAAVCEPNTVDLTAPSITVGSSGGIYSYWLNSAATIPLSTPSSTNNSGTYYIQSTSENGCKITQPVIVTINPLPTAVFTPSPSTIQSNNPVSTMINSSIGGIYYEWIFPNGNTSNLTNPTHTFSTDTFGDLLITLIVTSADGCKDTTTKTITLTEELIFYVPNSFTPDGNKFNETFQPVFTSGFDPNGYTMFIFNRWGEIVFETHDLAIGWDGTIKDKRPSMAQDGLYSWKIEYKLKENDRREMIVGHVNLIR